MVMRWFLLMAMALGVLAGPAAAQSGEPTTPVGNWIVHWENGGAHREVYVTVSPGKAGFTVHGQVSSSIINGSTAMVPVGAGRYEVDWQPWYISSERGSINKSYLSQAGSDALTGKWSPFDDRPEEAEFVETWTRAYPQVLSVQAVTQTREAATGFTRGFTANEVATVLNFGPGLPVGTPPKLSLRYADPTQRKGERTAHLFLYGQNLWGAHDVRIYPEDSGVSVQAPEWLICTPGTPDDPLVNKNIGVCRERGAVAGAVVSVSVGEAAVPGSYELTFDGQTIPFELEITGLSYRIGPVSIDAEVAQARGHAARQAYLDALSEVETLERAIARGEASLTTQEAIFNAEAGRIRADYEAAVAAAGDDAEAISRERAYSERLMTALLHPVEAVQMVLDADRDAYARALEALGMSGARMYADQLGPIPPLVRIETADALLVAQPEGEMTDLMEIDAEIRRYADRAVDLKAQRIEVLDALEEAGRYADRISADVATFTYGSNILQAFTQGTIQILDAARNSGGDPYKFAGLAASQIVINAKLSPAEFYSGALDADGNYVTQVPYKADSLEEGIVKSMLGSADKYAASGAVGDLLKRLPVSGAAGTLADSFDPAQMRTLGRARDALARSLRSGSQTLASHGDQTLGGSLAAGILLDLATEEAKRQVAEFMTEDILRDYANAQMAVSGLVTQLATISKLEEFDRAQVAALRALRNELSAEQGRVLGRYRIRPALNIGRNEGFAPDASYTVTLEWQGLPPPYDLYIAGEKAVPDGQPNRFVLGAAVMGRLTRGYPDRLPLEIVFR